MKKSYADFGKYIVAGGKVFQVAPENIVREDGSPWWYFDEAQELAQNAPDGWRLPTPAEAILIATQASYDRGEKLPSVDAQVETFDEIELVGTGLSLGNHSQLFGQDVGERVAFWTDTMREHTGIIDMPAGYALVLHHSIAELGTILTEDRGACVRLIREVHPSEIYEK